MPSSVPPSASCDNRLTLVIPVYNEEAGIFANIQRVATILDQAGIPHCFVLVDDGSRDNTWAELQRLAETISDIRAIRLSRNFGKEAALCAGLDQADSACCVCLDADLQHPPEIIPKMYQLWLNDGFHVVEGVKENRGKETFLYKLSAKVFYGLLRRTSGIDLRNASDFRLLDRKALAAWRALPEKQTFFRGMSSWIGFRRTQVRFTVADRKAGTSKWSVIHLAKLAVGAITSYSAVPLYFSAISGCLFLFLFGLLLLQTLYMKFSGRAVSGFTTVIALQLIIGGTLMIGAGIIGLYLQKIYEEIKGRPRYLIQETAESAPRITSQRPNQA